MTMRGSNDAKGDALIHNPSGGINEEKDRSGLQAENH